MVTHHPLSSTVLVDGGDDLKLCSVLVDNPNIEP